MPPPRPLPRPSPSLLPKAAVRAGVLASLALCTTAISGLVLGAFAIRKLRRIDARVSPQTSAT